MLIYRGTETHAQRFFGIKREIMSLRVITTLYYVSVEDLMMIKRTLQHTVLRYQLSVYLTKQLI